MITIEEIRLNNLRLLVKEYGTQKALAEVLNKAYAQINQWMNRSTNSKTGKPRSISSRMCREIEEKLEKPMGWMDIDHGLGNVTEIKQADFNRVPLISWSLSKNWRDMLETFKAEEALDWPPCPVPHSRATFALRIQGTSMHNPAGRPDFSEGDIIFIDPEVPPQHRRFVLVNIVGEKESVFRQLIVEGGKSYLFALNPIWPERMVPVDETMTIIGVLIVKHEVFT